MAVADTKEATDRAAADLVNTNAISSEAQIRTQSDLKVQAQLDTMTATIVALEARVSLLEHPVVTPPAPGLTISGITVTNVTQTGATVSWTVSDFATGQVEYGTTTAYGKTTTLEPSFTYKAHSQTISGLLAGTLYHFKCLSQDQGGHTATSADTTFTTLTAGSPPTSAPTVTATAKNKEVDLGWV